MGDNKQRNRPCWCGSGRKYKYCHLPRERMSALPLEHLLQALDKNRALRQCLHPNASPENCGGKIAKAHTVPRHALQSIAENGHVCSFAYDLVTLLKTEGKIHERLIGVAKASTFTGFCQTHDSEVFAPLERQAFAPSAETALLLTLRAISREIHDKMINAGLYEHQLELDRGRRQEDQQAVHNAALLFHVGTRAALLELRNLKQRIDAMWSSRDFGQSYYLAYRLTAPSTVMCSGSATPSEDFEGARLQNLSYLLTPTQRVCFSSFSDGSVGWLVFSWDGESMVADRLIASLLRQPPTLHPHSIIRFIFESLSNTFFAPSWWAHLSAEQQTHLRFRMQASADPSTPSRDRILVDDGRRFIDWQVEQVFTRLRDAA
jgi:SEC-C motif